MASCIASLGANPDLFVTQNADFNWKICLTSPPMNEGVEIACIEPTKLTFAAETCFVVGQKLAVLCNPDCELKIEGEYTIAAVSANFKELTIEPALPGVTAKKCYTQDAISVSEGCLGGVSSTSSEAPVVVALQPNWSLFGAISYNLDAGFVKSGGVNTTAGSKRVTSTLMNLFEAGQHINIPAAGIIDATIVSVSDSVDAATGTPIKIAVLDMAANQTTCAAATVAEGLLINFEAVMEGTCIRAHLPAWATRKLRPRPASEAPADCKDPSSFLGYYFIGGQTVNPVTGKIETFEITSGCANLRQTAMASNRLLTE